MKRGSDEWADFQPAVTKAADEVLAAILDIDSIFDLTMEFIKAELPYAYEEYTDANIRAEQEPGDARAHQKFIDGWYSRVFDPAKEIVVSIVLAEALKQHSLESKYIIMEMNNE